ncbi:hypothetical protein [Acidovorax sp. FJL06]|uniref:hypothetical protein n=1 Tax=Acidovorax sp. FJL06 TaxID=2153365 RepID=UPI000F584A10|nr:hypothetical protein [Acidovorax sp. FJL06]RQO81048.1 hypothetical protein DBV10_16605 [Acidovorax sp. FJL06]
MTFAVSPCPARRQALTRAETGLLLAVAALLALALFGPVLPASAHQHAFADQRALWGMPCALDVLSNLPFAMAGLWGLALLRRVPQGALDAPTQALAALFFVGLLCTAGGSMLYHWQPQDGGLLWDRMGMVLPFAGLMGLAAASRVSLRSGAALAATVLLAGCVAVVGWSRSGNLLPWAVVQLGGMLVVLALACLPRREGALALHLGAVMALYALAKLFEAADHPVFEATAQWVSGHTLKHLLAAGAAWPVLSALAALRNSVAQGAPRATPSGQNGAHTVGGARRSRA